MCHYSSDLTGRVYSKTYSLGWRYCSNVFKKRPNMLKWAQTRVMNSDHWKPGEAEKSRVTHWGHGLPGAATVGRCCSSLEECTDGDLEEHRWEGNKWFIIKSQSGSSSWQNEKNYPCCSYSLWWSRRPRWSRVVWVRVVGTHGTSRTWSTWPRAYRTQRTLGNTWNNHTSNEWK